MAFNRLHVLRRKAGEVTVATHDHLANHAGQAHFLTVFRAVNTRHTVRLQFADFRRHNDATAAAKNLNVLATAAFQQVDHVLEVFDVAALVAADGDTLGVFLQRCCHHFLDAAVVPQMNHLGAHALQNAPHDVDGGIVPVKQRGRRNKTHLVRGAVVGKRLVFGGQVSHVFPQLWH